MATTTEDYPAGLNIDYPEKSNRLTTFFRLVLAIPIFLLFALVSGTVGLPYEPVFLLSEHSAASSHVQSWYGYDSIGQITANVFLSLYLATMLMIVLRKKYPRWWFDFLIALNKFAGRIWAYLSLLTDQYPSTDEEQSYHLELDYPDVENELNRWLPLFKWILAIPHYIVLIFLSIGMILSTIIAWFAIMITGKYPRPLFEYVVGTFRWYVRVYAYAIWLVTDRYPPFSLK